jgi:chitodextrinase
MQLRALVFVAAAATCVALGISGRAEAAIANADTYVSAARPHHNFGARTYLRVGRDPVTRGYVRFRLRQDVPGSARVILRLYVIRAGSSRVYVHRVRARSWREDEITFANAPRLRRSIVSGRPKTGSWLLLDVSSVVRRRGSYTFALTSGSLIDSSGLRVSSKATDSATYLGSGKRTRKARLVLDTAAPSRPTGLADTGSTPTSISLVWQASTDDTGVSGYDVYENGAKVAQVARTSSTVSGLTCETTSFFAVAAYDAAGNRSPQSDPVSATTDACDAQPPSQRSFGTLNTLSTKASLEASAGINTAQIDVGWDLYEPQDGVFDSAYASSIAQRVQLFRGAGYRVVLGLALHYPPRWVFSYPDSRFVNQYGGRADEVNLIFNHTLRQKAAALMNRLNQDVGLNNFHAIRISSGGDAEALYPPEDADGTHGNAYWAYDGNARGGADLPPTIPANPFPGWEPGQTTYSGQPFTASNLQQWYSWYLTALLDEVDWQIQSFKKLGYTGSFQVLTPGVGSRPAEYQTAIANYLSGPGDSNSTMGRGAVWDKWYDMLPDKTNVMAYVTSMADWSGSPANNVCQATDVSVGITDPQIENWSATRWISYNADRHNMPKSGENPGGGPYYGLTMMQAAAKQMQACDMQGLYWAHDANLYDSTSGVTVENYADVIAQYR